MASNGSLRLEFIAKNITSKRLTDVAYPVFVANTPIKTGNARRHTKKNTDEINANYPYAQRLDNGYSRQSPDGMTKPTIAAVQAYVRKTLGK